LPGRRGQTVAQIKVYVAGFIPFGVNDKIFEWSRHIKICNWQLREKPLSSQKAIFSRKSLKAWRGVAIHRP
jgi:hypothetical protein